MYLTMSRHTHRPNAKIFLFENSRRNFLTPLRPVQIRVRCHISNGVKNTFCPCFAFVRSVRCASVCAYTSVTAGRKANEWQGCTYIDLAFRCLAVEADSSRSSVWCDVRYRFKHRVVLQRLFNCCFHLSRVTINQTGILSYFPHPSSPALVPHRASCSLGTGFVPGVKRPERRASHPTHF
jgi:hypothetical protein